MFHISFLPELETKILQEFFLHDNVNIYFAHLYLVDSFLIIIRTLAVC